MYTLYIYTYVCVRVCVIGTLRSPLYIHNTPTDSSLSLDSASPTSRIVYIAVCMGIGQTDRHDQFHVIYMFWIKCRCGFFFLFFFSHSPFSCAFPYSYIRRFVTVSWTITHRSKCGYYIPTSLQLPIYINYTHT